MAKDFAQGFYNSTAWKECREAYKRQQRFLCERCLAQGLLVPGEIVHHKIRITPATIDDPAVTLNFENLELLCRKHHEEEHRRERGRTFDRRYTIGPDGHVNICE